MNENLHFKQISFITHLNFQILTYMIILQRLKIKKIRGPYYLYNGPSIIIRTIDDPPHLKNSPPIGNTKVQFPIFHQNPERGGSYRHGVTK